jgi:hypothetical protein
MRCLLQLMVLERHMPGGLFEISYHSNRLKAQSRTTYRPEPRLDRSIDRSTHQMSVKDGPCLLLALSPFSPHSCHIMFLQGAQESSAKATSPVSSRGTEIAFRSGSKITIVVGMSFFFS